MAARWRYVPPFTLLSVLLTSVSLALWFTHYSKAHNVTQAAFKKLQVSYQASKDFHKGCTVYLAVACIDVLLLAGVSVCRSWLHARRDAFEARPSDYVRFKRAGVAVAAFHCLTIVGLVTILLIIAASIAVLHTEHNAVASVFKDDAMVLRPDAQTKTCPPNCFSPARLVVVFPFLKVQGACVCNLQQLDTGCAQLYTAVVNGAISLLFGLITLMLQLHMLAMVSAQITGSWYDHQFVAKQEAAKEGLGDHQFATNLYVGVY